MAVQLDQILAGGAGRTIEAQHQRLIKWIAG
jgi:hypothetical protein